MVQIQQPPALLLHCQRQYRNKENDKERKSKMHHKKEEERKALSERVLTKISLSGDKKDIYSR